MGPNRKKNPDIPPQFYGKDHKNVGIGGKNKIFKRQKF